MNKFFLFSAIILSSVLYTSCGKKFISRSANVERNKKLEVEEINFDYFESKTRIRYESENHKINGTASIRIKKDSIIWISVSPSLGIEVTRSIITPDTIIVVNRMDKEYYTFDFDDISQYFSFKIDYNLIQSILMANLPTNPNMADDISQTGNYTKISQKMGILNVESYINRDLKKLETVIMKQLYSQNQLTFKYSDFFQIGDLLFPKICAVNLTYDTPEGPSVTSVDIQHNKAEISDRPLRFPFNVPDKYVHK